MTNPDHPSPERITPLELNFDALNGVSYTKGCYIGQVGSSQS
jgi:folate-binding protein YgfZ